MYPKEFDSDAKGKLDEINNMKDLDEQKEALDELLNLIRDRTRNKPELDEVEEDSESEDLDEADFMDSDQKKSTPEESSSSEDDDSEDDGNDMEVERNSEDDGNKTEVERSSEDDGNGTEVQSSDAVEGDVFSTETRDKKFKKTEAFLAIRSDLNLLIFTKEIDNEDSSKDVLNRERWFSTTDIYALLHYYAGKILDQGKSRESDDNEDYASFIEAQVNHENILEVLETKRRDKPHILIVNHGEAHWQLLIQEDLLSKEQMESEGLEEDSTSVYYNMLTSIGNFLFYYPSYRLLKNDADGNCGPHVLLQIIQILSLHEEFRTFLTPEATFVYNIYHGNISEEQRGSNLQMEQDFDAGFGTGDKDAGEDEDDDGWGSGDTDDGWEYPSDDERKEDFIKPYNRLKF